MNEVGKPIKQYLYDPYGNLTNTTTDPINNFTFIGRYGGFRDWSTGMTQFQHRWYESKTGRWVSRDPIGTQSGINVYEYAQGNPENLVDVSGLCNKFSQPVCKGDEYIFINNKEINIACVSKYVWEANRELSTAVGAGTVAGLVVCHFVGAGLICDTVLIGISSVDLIHMSTIMGELRRNIFEECVR
jgi:RHS repeat-associated protein